jgi:adenine-specific DNA glycosylase
MKRTIHQKIAAWYAANGRRDLPWRNSDNSYHIYLSE